MKRSKSKPSRRSTKIAVLLLALMLPGLLGGCPDFRDSTVDVVDALTRDVIFGASDPADAVGTATVGILNAALDLFFDQFRSDRF
jgi:hypothetical protein